MKMGRFDFQEAGTLLRGEPEPLVAWTRQWSMSRFFFYVILIVAGAGLYGASMGFWRGPLQAFYSSVKLPVVVLLTTFGNALLNGMLAPLLGINLRFRESMLAILISFAIAAIILGAFSPLIFFLVWNIPTDSAGAGVGSPYYSLALVTEVFAIAFAGIVANVRLVQLLERLGGSASVARRILFSWLAGNLLLGAQLSWNLRPFLGTQIDSITFLSPHPFQGNFYEAVFRALRALLSF